mmetsp:Transcript_10225/g.30213  ORF Transcript_10225/g.30213 Transcript_10225/m.30213 type:complete len:237 (+) Transcript_10225:1443-2153(+)
MNLSSPAKPRTFVSTAASTLRWAPRRARRGPKMASFSVSAPLEAPRRPRYSAKNMSVPHSSSMERRKLPCAPVTKPTASCGTRTTVRSSSWSASSMETGPTRWAITASTYFFARARASGGPKISSVRERSKSSMRAPETRASFSLVLPCLPRMKAASSSEISSTILFSSSRALPGPTPGAAPALPPLAGSTSDRSFRRPRPPSSMSSSSSSSRAPTSSCPISSSSSSTAGRWRASS